MAAHLRDITRTCSMGGCSRTATKELRNTYNAVCGYFCSKHADKALKDFKAINEG